ncbi:Predicted PurR-regulated permease PerM [Cnuella takakiae]|uniref:Predicted PurR-regulated permease PerM n=1 Tax=Cnuella takakiae TaxID=1302690 RepID=A0A1M4WKT0_9BACT|nr:AI-2E family transporter [Cnuella takakiae]OLY91690.1 AI-2E family transporter [Cnuella takakiae]SHE81804.1 Predicted PurR-regulated permease PerM [Cnuella takakiae]
MDRMPLTVRRAIEIMGLYFLGTIIIVAKDIITPLLMAFFLAIMLLPVYRFLRNRAKFGEVGSIILSLFLLFLVLGGLIWFFSSQIGRVVQDFPQIRENVTLHLNNLSHWFETKTGLSTRRQTELINQQNEKVLAWAGGMLGGAASSVTGIFVFIGLLPIYIFLLLFYKNLLLRFVFLWFPKDNHQKVEEAMRESEVIIKSYLGGLLIQITYITILLGGILLVIGIKHAILIGAIFAILNLIPYVGALIGNLIGVLLTLSSSQELWPIIAVLVTIAFVQFLDNNILMPRIVGSKVKINALVTIIGVIIAGAMAGVSGMFLSLPVIAVMKIIFDRTNNLKQWGVLFGDEKPQKSPMSWPVLRLGSKKVQEKLQQQNNIEPTDTKGKPTP